MDGKWHRKISFTAGQTGCMVQFCGKELSASQDIMNRICK